MPVGPTQALGALQGFSVSGPEWSVSGVEPIADAGAGAGAGQGSFGDMLASSLDNLTGLQRDAAASARALADGTATDVSEVVMAVERARLSMQLAAQIRQRGVEALQDVFHTTV
jgi:flagellar hook-basal body complex protein FliE